MEVVENQNPINHISLLEDIYQIKIETPDYVDQSPFANLKIRICIDSKFINSMLIFSLIKKNIKPD